MKEMNEYINISDIKKIADSYSKKDMEIITKCLELNIVEETDSKYPIYFVYINALHDFIKNILIHIKGKYILITYSKNKLVPNGIMNKEDAIKFINDDRLLRWYTTNLSMNIPKVVGLPMGMDYGTLKNVESRIQEERYREIVNEMEPIYNRKPICYFHMRYHFIKRNDDDILESDIFNKECIYYDNERITKEEVIKKISECMYVVIVQSYDTSKIWEALGVGTIPIILRSSYIPIYDGLPILVVENWNDINNELLTKTLYDVCEKGSNGEYIEYLEKIGLEYWMNDIVKYSIKLERKFKQYRGLLCYMKETTNEDELYRIERMCKKIKKMRDLGSNIYIEIWFQRECELSKRLDGEIKDRKLKMVNIRYLYKNDEDEDDILYDRMKMIRKTYKHEIIIIEEDLEIDNRLDYIFNDKGYLETGLYFIKERLGYYYKNLHSNTAINSKDPYSNVEYYMKSCMIYRMFIDKFKKNKKEDDIIEFPKEWEYIWDNTIPYGDVKGSYISNKCIYINKKKNTEYLEFIYNIVKTNKDLLKNIIVDEIELYWITAYIFNLSYIVNKESKIEQSQKYIQYSYKNIPLYHHSY
jgi:hypothetical protein